MNRDKISLYEQYFKIKESNKDCIVVFQVGNFHQMFYYDAFIVSKELGLKKSIRALGGGRYTLMCGFPTSVAQDKCNILAMRGYKTIICNVVSDEKTGHQERKICFTCEAKLNKQDLNQSWQEYYEAHCNKTQNELKEIYGIDIVLKKDKLDTVKNIKKVEVQKKEVVHSTINQELLYDELNDIDIHYITMKDAFDILVNWKKKYGR